MAAGYILVTLLIVAVSIIVWRSVIYFREKKKTLKTREFRTSSPEIVLSNRRDKPINSRPVSGGDKSWKGYPSSRYPNSTNDIYMPGYNSTQFDDTPPPSYVTNSNEDSFDFGGGSFGGGGGGGSYSDDSGSSSDSGSSYDSSDSSSCISND